MATSQKENKHSFASIALVIVIFGGMAALALIPVEVFQMVRMKEQEQILSWLGQETDLWIMMKIVHLLQWANNEASGSLDMMQISGNAKIDGWMAQRLHAGLIWSHVVFYRGGFMLMWGVFAIPLLIAMYMDGHYQREKRKAMFSSQSPVMHKYGIDMMKGAVGVLILWIFIPWHITMLIAPLIYVSIGIAGWLWISNMQKRM